MTDEMKGIIRQVMEKARQIDYIRPEDLPNIDLYMDQVTTFMDEQLSSTRRKPEDKILTKTMINNYAKNKLLPPPDKKRYSREHILMLTFIYYFKNILSISDIQTLLSPLAEKYFRTGDDARKPSRASHKTDSASSSAEPSLDMLSIYNEIFRTVNIQAENLLPDLIRRANIAGDSFLDAPEEARPSLQRFAFICLLSFDVYMKKVILEQLIDDMRLSESARSREDEKGKGRDKGKTAR